MRSLLVFLLFLSYGNIYSQQSLKAHSHNDYENVIPFWLAYYNHFSSIEADIWLVDNELYVAHDRDKIKQERTLDALYLQPLISLVKYNGGKPWHDHPGRLQLLIDIKSDAVPALSLLTEKLRSNPEVFDPSVNPDAVMIVISGNRPPPSEYENYPSFIYFDGLPGKQYTKEQMSRVPLVSENLKNITRWDGKGAIPEKDRKRLAAVIDSVHSRNLKIRFWNAPDSPEAWTRLLEAGVDLVNTDHINQLAVFLKKRE